MSDREHPAGLDTEPATITGPLEALLLMATEPVGTSELAAALGVPVPVVRRALNLLRAFYDETGRGFELREVGAGWRYYTRPEHHALISGWLLEGQQARLSQAALETLAVVAYLQPVSRSRVSAIRGVNVDGVLRTLVTRDLVEEGDRDPQTGAILFRTTDHFLERMGMTSLDELPPIAPHLPEASLLEAELSGLAGPAEVGEDGPMSEQQSPQSAPSARDVEDWAQAQAAESGAHRASEAETEQSIPDQDLLDRLSDPE